MKIELMSQAAQLAGSCLYTKYTHGCEITETDIDIAEDVILKLFELSLPVSPWSPLVIKANLVLKRIFGTGEPYFDAITILVNGIVKFDKSMKSLTPETESKIRNQLQILVCSADEAVERLENEKASTTFQTAS